MNENTELCEKIHTYAEPAARSQGLEIWGLEVVGGPKTRVRLFVDIPEAQKKSLENSGAGAIHSANIDQCEEISRMLSVALEVEDAIAGPWVLEVSSPGLERRFFNLRQMEPYVGDMIACSLNEPLVDDRKIYRGRLMAVGGDYFELEPCSVGADGQILPENLPVCHIPWQNVKRASRIHIFEAPQKPGKGKAPASGTSRRKNES